MHENYRTLNLASQKAANVSHYKIYQTLAYMHQTEPALTEGSYRSFTTNGNKVLGVIRSSGARFVLLLINFEDDQPQVVDLSNEGFPAKLLVKVASLDSNVQPGY